MSIYYVDIFGCNKNPKSVPFILLILPYNNRIDDIIECCVLSSITIPLSLTYSIIILDIVITLDILNYSYNIFCCKNN
jgi:hypothetical protein